MSEDSRLRSSIRDLAMREAKLLDSIRIAKMEQQIQRRVIAFTKQNDKLVEETGIQSIVTEEEMKQYVDQVIEEVMRKKAITNRTNRTNSGDT